jgi:predicted DNA-binding protein
MLETTKITPGNYRLCLPDEIRERFRALSENIGATHRALGRVVDEYISEVPYGQHMTAYELFADLYHQVTGEVISARTIRTWRHLAIAFTKHDLNKYEALSDSQLEAAVSLSETAKVTPQEICEWTLAGAVDNVPAMRAHWLPPTTYEQDTDPPVISGLLRYAEKHLDPARRERFDTLLAELRELLRP